MPIQIHLNSNYFYYTFFSFFSSFSPIFFSPFQFSIRNTNANFFNEYWDIRSLSKHIRNCVIHLNSWQTFHLIQEFITWFAANFQTIQWYLQLYLMPWNDNFPHRWENCVPFKIVLSFIFCHNECRKSEQILSSHMRESCLTSKCEKMTIIHRIYSICFRLECMIAYSFYSNSY